MDAAILLIAGSIAFVALGLTLTLLPTSQLMSVVGNSSLLWLGCFRRTLDAHLFISRLDASNREASTKLSVDGINQDLLNEGGINLSATVYLLVFSAVFIWFDYLPSRS